VPESSDEPDASDESDTSDESDAGPDAGLPAEATELPPEAGYGEYEYESTSSGKRADGEQEALAKEPATHPDCAVDTSGGDVSRLLARYRSKLCTWMKPKERARLEEIDLNGTSSADPSELLANAHDEMLRKLAPKSLKRGRERSHRRFARELRRAPPGQTMAQGVMYDACYGDPFFHACEQVCDWDRPRTCRRCEDAWLKLEPLRIMCEPPLAETLVWQGTPAMGEGEIPASGAVYFAKVFEATVAAGVPRREVVRYAVELLDKLARQAREGDD
jgi:hypothetical protein